ncbi:tRNA (guanosine(46)-N7)-methyltransferase TrmB [Alkalihalobacterium alkalinitrilicum]|uniref:tRNA (guanosine(46)-N7)-methyltransferase TrmB n=1 Tax=Alkalihalobacterium alkalinitrilicum TaxID=427920 RepID=UPI000994E2A2|nr:tRNA (guanosine(46)-N7)-methyltransferase TrmB [Alkalihalobacterium alkalinitrilicum]
MRLRNKPWAHDEINKEPTIVIANPEQQKGNWNNIFGNNNPIHIEVGTGKGQFLTKMGQAHPHINYIGVEKYTSVIITAMERVRDDNISNVKFLNKDVMNLVDYFEKGELDQVFINFTDPWPKARHEKRRLTHEGFLKLYESLLKPHGEIHFKTDNQDLFEYSLHSFSKYGMILNNVSLDLHKSNMVANIMTEYEEKFSAKGMRIYRCEAVYR